MGKDAQFVGRSLMINLTAPILLFARMGFQSLLKVDEQFVRLTKILEGVAMTTDQANLKLKDYVGPDKGKRVKQMTDSFRELNTALTEQSSRFGVAKDLVVSLAVDFAELGVTANDNIVALTELALAAEKLGGMDASGAQDLSSALFFNATRAYEVAGAFDDVTTAAERESKAIASATTQLNMFNTIENVTALSLKDLADSLPELGGMALSFGLSMTEAAALLAPMKAAGFEATPAEEMDFAKEEPKKSFVQEVEVEEVPEIDRVELIKQITDCTKNKELVDLYYGYKQYIDGDQALLMLLKSKKESFTSKTKK
jgi:hypothetical protein